MFNETGRQEEQLISVDEIKGTVRNCSLVTSGCFSLTVNVFSDEEMCSQREEEEWCL